MVGMNYPMFLLTLKFKVIYLKWYILTKNSKHVLMVVLTKANRNRSSMAEWGWSINLTGPRCKVHGGDAGPLGPRCTSPPSGFAHTISDAILRPALRGELRNYSCPCLETLWGWYLCSGRCTSVLCFLQYCQIFWGRCTTFRTMP